MPEGHDTTIEVSNIMSFVLYTQILKQSVLKTASPGITLNFIFPLGQRLKPHHFIRINRILRHIEGGMRESNPGVWDLQSTTRLTESLMLQTLGMSPSLNMVINHFSHSCLK